MLNRYSDVSKWHRMGKDFYSPAATLAGRESGAELPTQPQTAVDMCGMLFRTGSFEETADWLIRLSTREYGKPAIVSHINIYNLFLLLKDKTYGNEIVRRCYLLFDGIGMKIGAIISGLGWLPDLNGTDLFPLVMQRASQSGVKVFFLGTNPHAIKLAAENSARFFPALQIAGYHTGYFSLPDEDEVVDVINRSGADMLLLGMGFPRQEHFALRHFHRLNVRLIWNVAGLFDFVSEVKPRAPRFLRAIRLEWLFRFLLEPRLMFYRNFVAAPRAIRSILSYRMKSFNHPL